MHLCDCTLGFVDLLVEYVCDAAINVESGIHGHPDIFDDAILSKYLTYVVLFDVSGQGFYHNLCTPGCWRRIPGGRAVSIAPPS